MGGWGGGVGGGFMEFLSFVNHGGWGGGFGETSREIGGPHPPAVSRNNSADPGAPFSGPHRGACAPDRLVGLSGHPEGALCNIWFVLPMPAKPNAIVPILT